MQVMEERMDAYFVLLGRLSRNTAKLSSKVRYACRDVIECRANRWSKHGVTAVEEHRSTDRLGGDKPAVVKVPDSLRPAPATVLPDCELARWLEKACPRGVLELVPCHFPFAESVEVDVACFFPGRFTGHPRALITNKQYWPLLTLWRVLALAAPGPVS